MGNIKIYQKVSLQSPIMLAAWPGMGNIALGTIDYLRRRLEMQPFAEIEMSQFVAPEMGVVEKGIISLPPLPRSIFYYKQPSLIVFESEAQLAGQAGVSVITEVLNLAQSLKTRRIYTTAAFPLPVSYQEPSQVVGVSNKKYLLDFLSTFGVKIMDGGQISGLNGLLLGYAAQRDIEAICLLATLPIYAVNFPNPKASKAVLEVLEMILDMQVNMQELDANISEMEEKMAMIEEKIKGITSDQDVMPGIPKKEKATGIEKEKVPNYIMEKIERIFNEAKEDKKKAYTLKEELDRWDLYELYEDRFLDLFRKEDQQ